MQPDTDGFALSEDVEGITIAEADDLPGELLELRWRGWCGCGSLSRLACLTVLIIGAASTVAQVPADVGAVIRGAAMPAVAAGAGKASTQRTSTVDSNTVR